MAPFVFGRARGEVAPRSVPSSKILGTCPAGYRRSVCSPGQRPIKAAAAQVAKRIEQARPQRCRGADQAKAEPLPPAPAALPPLGGGGRQKDGSVAWALPRGDLPMRRAGSAFYTSRTLREKNGRRGKGPAAKFQGETQWKIVTEATRELSQ
jgi:hypothetical protein